MIARIWRGWTRSEDADAYLEYLRETGLKEYRQTAAGDDVEQAVFYPEDDRFLVEREWTVTHYEVAAG